MRPFLSKIGGYDYGGDGISDVDDGIGNDQEKSSQKMMVAMKS